MYFSLFTTFTLASIAQAAIVGRAVTEQTLLTNMTIAKPVGDVHITSTVILGIQDHSLRQYAGKGVDIWYGWWVSPPIGGPGRTVWTGGLNSVISACNSSVSGDDSLVSGYTVQVPGEHRVQVFAVTTFLPFDGEYNATVPFGLEPSCSGAVQEKQEAIYEFTFTVLNETETGEPVPIPWENQTVSLSPAPSGLLSDVKNGAKSLANSVWMILGVVGVLVVA